MRKSLLLGLGGAAILGGWVLKSYLESKGESSANAGENLVAANAGNSAQCEKEAFRSELDEFSEFDSENSSLSKNFTHKEEKMTMRDLEALQEEALQDRAWLQMRPDYDALAPMLGMGLDEIKDKFSTPYLLRKQLASGILKSWLEYKIAECRKNEQAKSAYEDALQKVQKIPRNATRVEATKALYETFFGEKVSHELEEYFELEVRFHSLQAEGLNAIREIYCIRQKIVENCDVGLCKQNDALEWYVLDIWEAQGDIRAKINPKGVINRDVKDEKYIMHKMNEDMTISTVDLQCELQKLQSPEQLNIYTHFY